MSSNTFGLIELLLVFALVIVLALWQWREWRNWKRDQSGSKDD